MSGLKNELIRYPKIFHIGTKNTEGFITPDAMDNEIVIEEKMDGANFRFGVIDGKFRAGSRRVDFTPLMYPPNEPTTPVMNESALGQFFKAVMYAFANYADKLKDGYVYFAEYMIPHTLDYDWDNTPLLLGFDIYDVNVQRFLGYDEKIKEFQRIGMPTVPLVKRMKLRDLTVEEYEKLIPKSKYRDGVAEGVVIKDYARQWFVKVVTPEFREANLATFGAGARKKAKKYSKDGAEWFVNAFVTRQRIEKIITKLVEEQGKEPEMTLMKYLPTAVLEDAWEEHWKDVIYENVVIDTKRMRSLAAKRCVRVLRAWLVKRAILDGGEP